MGKIILTERQYRNLNQILIGKEVGKNKGRLNEGYVMAADGMSFTISLDDSIGYVGGPALKGGSLVKVNGKNELICKGCSYETKGSAEIKVGDYKFNCLNNTFTTPGGNLVIKNDTNSPALAKLCAKAKLIDYNWGGSGTDPDRYWNGLFAKLKPYGAKLSAGDGKSGPFMYWGKFIVYKNYSYNNGCTVIDYPTESYKFTDYGGKYVGQALDKIVLTPCVNKGASINITTLLGTPEVSAGTENPAGTDTNIVLFQRWYWSEKETEDLAPYVSGDKKDKCKAKYKSALCGGKPCIRTQAVDGKSGSNTTKLMTDATIKKEFDAWVKTNPSELADYSKLETCSSAEKGYDKPVVRGGGTGTGGTGGGTGTGGGGAPFSGQYADLV